MNPPSPPTPVEQALRSARRGSPRSAPAGRRAGLAWPAGTARLAALAALTALALGPVLLVAALLLPRPARAFGDRERFQVGQLQLGAAPAPRPSAVRRLMWEIDKRTSIEVRLEAVPVRLSEGAELLRYPLLYLAGDRDFPAPDEEDVGRLRRHLLSGGMLLIDSAEGRAGGGFDQSVRALLARVLPKAPLKRLPEDHVLFRSFYLLRTPAGRVIAQPFLEAVVSDGRALVVYSQNDLGGAWARDSFGQWEYDVVPGGALQREQAFRLGVNLAMYALCLDYKTDQVHVPFIMRRRSWQAGPPGAGVLP